MLDKLGTGVSVDVVIASKVSTLDKSGKGASDETPTLSDLLIGFSVLFIRILIFWTVGCSSFSREEPLLGVLGDISARLTASTSLPKASTSGFSSDILSKLLINKQIQFFRIISVL